MTDIPPSIPKANRLLDHNQTGKHTNQLRHCIDVSQQFKL